MSEMGRNVLGIVLSSGVIWAAIMVFRAIFRKKVSPVLCFSLWFVFMARLCLPFTIDVSLRLVPASVPLAASYTDEAYAAAAHDEALLPASHPPKMTESVTRHVQQPQEVHPKGSVSFPWREVIGVALFAGMGGYMVLLVRRMVLQNRRIRSCRKVPPWVQQVFADCCQELGIRNRPGIRMDSDILSPALTVSLCPYVLFPEKLAHGDERSVRFALLHELEHFRRHDHWLTLLMLILQGIWWFNPFVWLAFRTARLDMERACDSGVIGRLDQRDRGNYGRMIVSLASKEGTMAIGMTKSASARSVATRLRSLFYPQRTQSAYKGISVLLCCILGLTCFTTACQPTPAREAVISKADSQAFKPEQANSADPEESMFPTTAYSNELWQEEIQKGDHITIRADVDVAVPETKSVPIGKYAATALTQEMADSLIERFAGSGPYYAAADVRTKEDYEDDLLRCRKQLAESEAAGNETEIEGLQRTISEIEAAYEQAPASADRSEVSTDFDYATDLHTGEKDVDGGKRWIEISTENPRGGSTVVRARTMLEGDTDPRGSFFDVDSGQWITQTQLKGYLDPSLPAGLDSESREYYLKMEENARALLQSYESSPLDLAVAERQARDLLKELGIDDAQITACEYASFSPDADVQEMMKTEDMVPVAYLSFVREVDGIPAMGTYAGPGDETTSADNFAPAFVPERGDVVLDADGNVMAFYWESPAQLVASMTQGTILPFSDIKDRLVDQIYWAAFAVSGEDASPIVSEVETVDLVMTYVQAKDDIGKALLIPAWQAVVKHEYEEPPQMPDADMVASVDAGKSTITISALDGSAIHGTA